MTTLPWLDYSGQTTQDLLALARTHRVDSLLCAFEAAIQAKEADGTELTEEEKIVLAVEALQREVNNGGFHQFFVNSSNQYAPLIVESLHRIGAQEAAVLASAAIRELGLPEVTSGGVREAAEQAIVEENQELLETLESCDQAYYGISGIDEKLFGFVVVNAGKIRI